MDGAGRLLRVGGKVVKNAAGFDLPKFFVGSLGRFGALAEITFKVFPRPGAHATLMLEAKSPEVAVAILTQAAVARWEVDALDWLPDARHVAARLAAPPESLAALTREILNRWPGETLAADAAASHWHRLAEFDWAESPSAPLLKIPLLPAAAASLRQALETLGARVHISVGGNVAFAALAPGAEVAAVDARLRELRLRSLTLRGEAPLRMGVNGDFKITAAVKAALDAENRFPTPVT